MTTFDWRSVEDAGEPAWFALIDRLGVEPVRASCPSCGESTLRFYFSRPPDGLDDGAAHGGLWIWCPSCRRFMHMSVAVPGWWRTQDHVDDDDLQPEPAWLEAHWSELHISNTVP